MADMKAKLFLVRYVIGCETVSHSATLTYCTVERVCSGNSLYCSNSFRCLMRCDCLFLVHERLPDTQDVELTLKCPLTWGSKMAAVTEYM